jgi:hypothetical protein
LIAPSSNGNSRGENFDSVRFTGRALRLGVERAQRVDLVVEEVDADRRGAARRVDVEDGAAHRELAGLGDRSTRK